MDGADLGARLGASMLQYCQSHHMAGCARCKIHCASWAGHLGDVGCVLGDDSAAGHFGGCKALLPPGLEALRESLLVPLLVCQSDGLLTCACMDCGVTRFASQNSSVLCAHWCGSMCSHYTSQHQHEAYMSTPCQAPCHADSQEHQASMQLQTMLLCTLPSTSQSRHRRTWQSEVMNAGGSIPPLVQVLVGGCVLASRSVTLAGAPVIFLCCLVLYG